jgi:hypothetical protein
MVEMTKVYFLHPTGLDLQNPPIVSLSEGQRMTFVTPPE